MPTLSAADGYEPLGGGGSGGSLMMVLVDVTSIILKPVFSRRQHGGGGDDESDYNAHLEPRRHTAGPGAGRALHTYPVNKADCRHSSATSAPTPDGRWSN